MTSTTRLTLATPPDFHFWRTVFSHGWCDLAPFTHDDAHQTLGRTLLLPDGGIAACTLSGRESAVVIDARSARPLTSADRHAIRTQSRATLRLHENFGPFHARARRTAGFRWVSTSRSGRLLRAPTVFEDIVKMICTTNCTWALTKIMAGNLVGEFGAGADGLGRAFPVPSSIAGATESFLRKHCTTGYRSPFLLQFAEEVAAGKRDVERLRDPALTSDQLYEELVSIKGVGEYAAGNLMKLLGRYDRLGLDSWVRAQFAKIHKGGRRVSDRTIERYYAPFGEWRGLFFWLEMTKEWFDGESPL